MADVGHDCPLLDPSLKTYELEAFVVSLKGQIKDILKVAEFLQFKNVTFYKMIFALSVF